MEDGELKIFFEIHQDLPREGPGSRESMLKALSFMSELPAKPYILDVGCGPGKQTVALAKVTGGHIAAVDTHQAFLDRLERQAHDAGISSRVRTAKMSMSDLVFPAGSFDLIWSEGAIYIMGLREGLKAWKPLLKLGGYIAVTELSWLRPDPPEECLQYWNIEYPDMRSIPESLRIVTEEGYDLVGSFVLPDSDWWEDYYSPLEKRLSILEKQLSRDPEGAKLIEETRFEMDLHRKYSSWYGYVFFIARRNSP